MFKKVLFVTRKTGNHPDVLQQVNGKQTGGISMYLFNIYLVLGLYWGD